MAFEPYLLTRKRGCYRAPLKYASECQPFTPECIPDKYTSAFRERWNTLIQDPCKRKPTHRDPYACLLDKKTPLSPDEICIPHPYERLTSEYKKNFDYPWSHNNIGDCCKAPCPCLDTDEDKSPNIPYKCTVREELPPLGCCTTYREQFVPKPVPPRPQKIIEKWDPCECPLESATTYRIDYPHKSPVPNGPVAAKVFKYGMWSMDQFSDKAFPTETEHLAQFPPKYVGKRVPLPIPSTLGLGEGPMQMSSETCMQYPPKSIHYPPIPGWVSDDQWIPPDTPLEKCTTYNHFYRPHPIRPKKDFTKIRSPGAIPFPTLHNMWYTCCDPKVDQTTPVELKDNDPWPYVRVCPIRYQDNLHTDPCAPFRDDTTYKADYWAKQNCGRREDFSPCSGYTPPILPMNDDTTNRIGFRAYTREEYAGAKTNPGNPNGIKWGPYKCPPMVDKCLPRFPSPYGHPLKPFTSKCPCGPFDDRSTYYHDFKFRDIEMVRVLQEDMCQQPNVPKGVSLYRHDYVVQGGKPAERVPPPVSRAYRCMNPCSIRDTDTLYRMDYHDFWKSMQRKNLELYRGKPTIRTRRKKETEDEECEVEPYEIFAMPPGTTVQDVLDGTALIKSDK